MLFLKYEHPFCEPFSHKPGRFGVKMQVIATVAGIFSRYESIIRYAFFKMRYSLINLYGINVNGVIAGRILPVDLEIRQLACDKWHTGHSKISAEGIYQAPEIVFITAALFFVAVCFTLVP